MKTQNYSIPLTAAILGLATCFSFFSGCGGNSDETRVAFVTNQQADFWNIAKAGCADAEKEFGIKVEVKMPADGTAVIQKQIVEDLISSGIDAIAISPLDADNQTEWLNGIAAKVPLITHDSDAPKSKRICYIGMDNYKAGRMCGELVKEALPDGGGVMLLIGRMEQNNSKHRRQGVIDELFGRDYPESLDKLVEDKPYTGEGSLLDTGKYQILDTLTAPTNTAKQKAADAITGYPEMKAMVGLFEYNPPACYQALKQVGKLGEIKLIGFDENVVTLQGIKEGHITGTIVQDPYQYGYQSVKILKDLLDKKKVLPFIDIPPRKITKENVDAYKADLDAKKGG